MTLVVEGRLVAAVRQFVVAVVGTAGWSVGVVGRSVLLMFDIKASL